MDDLDYKIIEVLGENGRCSYKEIARNLKVSDGTVRLRTEKMIRDGFVKIKAMVSPFKLEHRVYALIGVNLERRGHAQKMKEISNLKGVLSVSNATGRYDLLIEIFVKSQKELSEFLVNKISNVEGIRATETFVYLDGINRWIDLTR